LNKSVIVDESLATPVVLTKPPAAPAAEPAYAVLGAISFTHFLNDIMQSLIPSLYPVLKQNFALDFVQIGFITLAFQFTASLLQPVVGFVTDRKAQPFSLAIGMASTFLGLLLLSVAGNYAVVIIAAAMVGLGSAVFHPESSRIARLASGGRFGFAQSVFQVGGNCGAALGPLLAALIVVPFGQSSIAGLSLIAFAAIIILWRIGRWYKPRIVPRKSAPVARHPDAPARRGVVVALAILVLLTFSKAIYTVSISSYYTFYLMHKFGVSTQYAQFYLFMFLAAAAAGTFFGGPIGDRFGRRYVIWFSILGALPFTLLLPYVGPLSSAIISMLIGFIISSSMPAIIVYAQELMPHRLGMISGLFFGFAFGAAGLGAALLGGLADYAGIDFVYQVCAFLPAIGLLAVFLPRLKSVRT